MQRRYDGISLCYGESKNMELPNIFAKPYDYLILSRVGIFKVLLNEVVNKIILTHSIMCTYFVLN